MRVKIKSNDWQYWYEIWQRYHDIWQLLCHISQGSCNTFCRDHLTSCNNHAYFASDYYSITFGSFGKYNPRMQCKINFSREAREKCACHRTANMAESDSASSLNVSNANALHNSILRHLEMLLRDLDTEIKIISITKWTELLLNNTRMQNTRDYCRMLNDPCKMLHDPCKINVTWWLPNVMISLTNVI